MYTCLYSITNKDDGHIYLEMHVKNFGRDSEFYKTFLVKVFASKISY